VIDQARVESVLLLATDAQARETMAYRERVPRGCAQALTMTGFRYYPDPNYRSYPANVNRRPQFLQVSAEQAIQEKQAELQQCRLEAQTVTASVGRARAALEQARQQDSQAKRQLQAGMAEMHKTNRELRLLESREPPQPVNLQALEEEVESFSGDIAESEEREAVVAAQVRELREQLRAAEQEKRDTSGNLRSRFGEKSESIETELEKLEMRRGKWERILAQTEQKLAQVRGEEDQKAETLAERGRKLEAAAGNATGERVEPRQPVDQIQSRLHGLEATVEREQQKQPNQSWEEINQNYQQAQLRFQRMEGDVEQLKKELNMLQIMLTTRLKRCDSLKLSLSTRIRTYFYKCLSMRDFKGNIQFDHESRHLSLLITTGGPGAGRSGSSTSKAPQQLSGGERSFSTLAFILAMWNAMHSPFRMLDEFDVYMDEVNRKICQDMLMKDAKSHDGQYVFISPLAVEQHEGSRVSYFTMAPPKRETGGRDQ